MTGRGCAIAGLALLTVFVVRSAQADIQAAFACDNGLRLDVVFAEGDPGSAEIRSPAGTWRLPQGQSGSGARYTDGSAVFWNKGREALFEAGEIQTDCGQLAPAEEANGSLDVCYSQVDARPAARDCFEKGQQQAEASRVQLVAAVMKGMMGSGQRDAVHWLRMLNNSSAAFLAYRESLCGLGASVMEPGTGAADVYLTCAADLTWAEIRRLRTLAGDFTAPQ